MDEQELAEIEGRWDAVSDIWRLLAEVRRLRGMWLLEKSRADRHEGELSVLRPAVARVGALAERWGLYSDPYHGVCADELVAALTREKP